VYGQNTIAQIKEITLLTSKPAQYDRAEFQINLVSEWENPYLQEDVALNMQILAPHGAKLTLPCYYESGSSKKKSVWKARFTPQETGNYTYHFELIKKGKLISTSKTLRFNAAAPQKGKNGFLHPKSNWVFEFDNGKPFRGVAENICWESRATDDSKFFKELHEENRFSYDYMLPDFAANGGNFFRTWMCAWNLPIDRKDNFNNHRYTASDEYYNPSALARMDYMIELSESLDLYIMLTLGQGAWSVREGGFATSNADFFVNQKAKERYKNRLRYIVARWGYSPNIAVWEFFNEVDNVQYRDAKNPIDGKSIVDWHAEMSSYLKQLDPYGRIVSTSISHRDIEGLNSIPDIDLNQKHIYKHTRSIPSEIVKYTEKYHKPYVIGEFGFEWDWSKNFNDFAQDMELDFKRGLWYGLFSPTPITPMSWWWEFFEDKGMNSYFKGVREINDKMLQAGNGEFEVLPIQASNLDAFCIKCGEDIFVYLYNDTVSTIPIETLIEITNNKQYTVQRFTPTTLEYDSYGSTTSARNAITIKCGDLGSKEEAVLLFTPNK